MRATVLCLVGLLPSFFLPEAFSGVAYLTFAVACALAFGSHPRKP